MSTTTSVNVTAEYDIASLFMVSFYCFVTKAFERMHILCMTAARDNTARTLVSQAKTLDALNSKTRQTQLHQWGCCQLLQILQCAGTTLKHAHVAKQRQQMAILPTPNIVNAKTCHVGANALSNPKPPDTGAHNCIMTSSLHAQTRRITHLLRGGGCTHDCTKTLCACAQRTGAAARESLRQDCPDGLTSPAFHVCGSASPFRVSCCHSSLDASST